MLRGAARLMFRGAARVMFRGAGLGRGTGFAIKALTPAAGNAP